MADNCEKTCVEMDVNIKCYFSPISLHVIKIWRVVFGFIEDIKRVLDVMRVLHAGKLKV